MKYSSLDRAKERNKDIISDFISVLNTIQGDIDSYVCNGKEDICVSKVNGVNYRLEKYLNQVSALKKDISKVLTQESKSRYYRKSKIKESAGSGNIDGYAVQINDMGKGYIHLALFDSIEDAETAYETLELIADDDGYDSDEHYNIDIENALYSADEIVNEVDWRREIDKDDVWTAADDTRYQIIGEVPLYVYW